MGDRHSEHRQRTSFARAPIPIVACSNRSLLSQCSADCARFAFLRLRRSNESRAFLGEFGHQAQTLTFCFAHSQIFHYYSLWRAEVSSSVSAP